MRHIRRAPWLFGCTALAALALLAAGLGVVASRAGGDAATGPLLAIVPLSGFAGQQDAIVDSTSGHVIVGAVDSTAFGRRQGRVTIVDTRTGAVLRTVSMAAPPTLLALNPGNGRIVAVSRAGTAMSQVHLLDPASGLVSRGVLIGTPPGAIAIDGSADRAFIAGGGGSGANGVYPYTVHSRVVMLDLRTMRVLHTTAVGSSPTGVAVDDGSGRVAVETAAGLQVLDAASGALLRTFPRLTQLLAVDQRTDRIVAADDAGRVFLLDARTGRLGGAVPMIGAAPAPGGVAIDMRNGRVVLLTRGAINGSGIVMTMGLVRILDGTTGQVLQTASVDGQSATLALWGDRAVIAAYDGSTSVTLFDPQHGQTPHLIDVGLVPSFVAVDGRAGRIVVVGNESASLDRRPRDHDLWGWMPAWLRRAIPVVPPPPSPTPSGFQPPVPGVSVVDPTR